jgi:heterodisulfide reductase subunit B
MKRFAFFPGCLIPSRHPAMEFAIRATLEKLEIEIVDLEGASCCPDPIYFKSKDKVSWLAVAARNRPRHLHQLFRLYGHSLRDLPSAARRGTA